MKLVISDQHSGLVKALGRAFQGVGRQRCRVHFARNLLAHVPKARRLRRRGLPDDLRPARRHRRPYRLGQDPRRARRPVPEAGPAHGRRKGRGAGLHGLPREPWRKIWSTNPLERLNKEIKRRSRVVGIFPNAAAVVRLIGAVLTDIHDEWIAGDRRYLSEGSMAKLYETSDTELVAAIESSDA